MTSPPPESGPIRHALVVEDDQRIREQLVALLRAEGLEVRPAATLGVARSLVTEDLDLVLLDLGLPDGDGLDLCRDLRAAEREVAVVMLTARDDPDMVVAGLDAGADDYVVKPYRAPELLARVRSALRRVPRSPESRRLTVGPLWAEPETRRAGTAGHEVRLKPRELDLLVFLLRHPGRPWSRAQLLARVWGLTGASHGRTVDVHVRRLREQLEEDPGNPRLLLTEFGVGYRLEEPAP